MRAALLFLFACAAQHASPEPLPEDELVWASVQPGDTLVAVPGTGAYSNLGTFIDQSATLDWRSNQDLNPIVLEQAIAAAERAQVPLAQLHFAVWGSGATRTSFTYTSLGGQTIEVAVLGGANAVATGTIADHLLDYTKDNVDRDARDLGARLPQGRITLVAHSYGGAVAEYFAQELADPRVDFVVAAGVPSAVVGYTFGGPGLRPAGAAELYEIDRPDDPVHTLHFAWDIEGHQYDIMYGDSFQGSYGITTDELSCHQVPGPCAN